MVFRIGQKIVCIVKIPPQSPLGEALPRYGSVYTVRGLPTGSSGPGVYLEEIQNPPAHTVDGFVERYFEQWGFRPVVEKKTDISIFTAMLKTQRQPARA